MRSSCAIAGAAGRHENGTRLNYRFDGLTGVRFSDVEQHGERSEDTKEVRKNGFLVLRGATGGASWHAFWSALAGSAGVR